MKKILTYLLATMLITLSITTAFATVEFDYSIESQETSSAILYDQTDLEPTYKVNAKALVFIILEEDYKIKTVTLHEMKKFKLLTDLGLNSNLKLHKAIYLQYNS